MTRAASALPRENLAKKIGIARGEGDSEIVYVFWEENLRASVKGPFGFRSSRILALHPWKLVPPLLGVGTKVLQSN